MIRQTDRRTLSPEMPLTAFYDAYVHPVHRIGKDADPKTVALDRTALKHWREITGDPPLNQIDEFTTAEYVAGLRELPGRHGQKMRHGRIVNGTEVSARSHAQRARHA